MKQRRVTRAAVPKQLVVVRCVRANCADCRAPRTSRLTFQCFAQRTMDGEFLIFEFGKNCAKHSTFFFSHDTVVVVVLNWQRNH